MRRFYFLAMGVVVTTLASVSTSEAQVSIRVPFVRINVGGDGVSVRAPFVKVYVPPSGPVYGPLYPPPVVVESLPPPVVVIPPPPPGPKDPFPPAEKIFTPPPPFPANPNLPMIHETDRPPLPIQPVQAPTLEQFSKTFQAKAGSYEVVIVNPITKRPTPVRFMLPEGEPRRVLVRRESIEFFYGIGRWVRIEFDRDGVQVTTR